MATIPLTQGKSAIVDDADAAELLKYRWRAKRSKHGTWYAQRDAEGIFMHRQIMGFPKSRVDHRNRDGLDNRRSNLRLGSQGQNLLNQIKTRGTSKYKGVSWHKPARKWVVQFRFNNKRQYLGLFDNEEEAAEAYNRAALLAGGEFARLNILPASTERTVEWH